MTEVLTLQHVIDGQTIAGAATILHHNPADLRIELPEADDALIRAANAAAAPML